MNAFKTSVSALALVAVTAGGIGATALLPSTARAETTQTAPDPAGKPAPDRATHGWHNRFDPAARARFLEGRIAYLKTVLQITPQQEKAFNTLADAMRANAKDRMDTWQQMKADRDQSKTVLDRLEMRVKFSQMHTQQQERILAAFKPLYSSLSPEQQKLAGALLHEHGLHRGGPARRG